MQDIPFVLDSYVILHFSHDRHVLRPWYISGTEAAFK